MSNPFTFGGPVAPGDFYGRSDSIEFILDRLFGRSRSSVALWGDRRVGKSSLLHYLYQPKLRRHQVKNPGRDYVLYLDCQIFTSFDRSRFWQEVLEQISLLVTDTSLPQEAEELLQKESISERAVRGLFRRMQRRSETLTLMMDEFGHLASFARTEAREEIQALLAFMRTMITAVNPAGTIPRPLALLVSTRRPLDEVCRPIYGERDAGSPFHNPFVFERLKPFEIEDVHALLQARLEDTTIQFSEGETAKLLASAGRHPILVQSYASELFNAKESDMGEIADYSALEERFFERNRQHFHDFWVYSSKAERKYLARVLGEIDVDSALTRNQERAKHQLVERGLIGANDVLFSPIFARWLRLNVSALLAELEGNGIANSGVQLLQAIDAHFSEGELRQLCFELGVDFDNLRGSVKREKAQSLVEWMGRYGRTEELVATVQKLRPLLRLA